MNRIFLLAGTAAGVMFAAACGGSSPASVSNGPAVPAVATSAPAANSAPAVSSAPAAASTGATVSVASSKLGQILVDGRGLSLYLFEADTTPKSTCFNRCAQNWPPLLTSGSPMASGSANQALLGTTARGDGTTQVTYNGHPLYFFVSDSKPGDVAGEGLTAFGAGWDVLSPSGVKIEGGS